jgi:hypothetical protein
MLTPEEKAIAAGANGSATPPPKTPTRLAPHTFSLPSHADITKSVTGPNNPFLPLMPIVTGAARALGTPVSKIFDVLNRPGAASEARALRGNRAGGTTFLHSETPEQYQADTAELARRSTGERQIPEPIPQRAVFSANPGYGPVVKQPMTKAEYDKMPGWWHQGMELLTQIRYDPTTYAGAAGVFEHLSEALWLRSFPAFSRAVEAMTKSPNPSVQLAGKGLAHAYDVTHYKGETQRALAAKSGAEGIHQFRGLRAINNARRNEAYSLSHELGKQYAEVTKGLKSDQEQALYEAIHHGTVDELKDPVLQARAAKFKEITNSLAHLQGTKELRTSLREGFLKPGTTVRGRAPLPGEIIDPAREGGGFTLPPMLERFDQGAPRGLQGVGSYRRHYVPTRHEAQTFERHLEPDSILGLDQAATGDTRKLAKPLEAHDDRHLADILNNPREQAERTTSTVERNDKNLLERGAGAQLEKDPKAQRELIDARLRGGAQAIAAHDAEGRVAELFGKNTWAKVPADAKNFFQETWNEPGGKEFWGKLARGTIDIPKAGLFAVPFRHMANIGSLLFLADPSLGALGGTARRFFGSMVAGLNHDEWKRIANDKALNIPSKARALLSRAGPDQRMKLLGDAMQYGVAGRPPLESVGWVGKIPGVGELYKASNHVLWTFDDAAKATRFNRLLKQYQGEGADKLHAAYRAADQVGAELIDYSNNSPLTHFLRYMLPFATYRSKAPLAVARSLTRHPERATNLGRRSPELIGDLQQGPPNAQGQPQVGKSYLPLAETFRGVENPPEFVRSTLGFPLAMTASAIGGRIAKSVGRSDPDVANYATYGKDPDLKYLANAVLGSFPGGEAALGALGQGEFTNQGSLSGAIRSQTGFGLTRGPSPTQLLLPGFIQRVEQQAAKARAAGDNATADTIEKAIERIRERYRLYVP